jgi:hypothetical protein
MDYPYSEQAPADTTPADVVQRVAAALDARRWTEVAALVDPRDVARFAAEQVAELRELETGRRMSDAMRRRPGFSAESLERFAAHEEETRKALRARFADMYGGRDTSEELRQLAPEALFLLWLAASDPVAQVRRSVAQVKGINPEFAGSALQAAPAFRREIVGTEYEGTDNARVRYLEWIAPPAGPEAGEGVPRDVMLRRVRGEWRVAVDAELMGHASLSVGIEPAPG